MTGGGHSATVMSGTGIENIAWTARSGSQYGSSRPLQCVKLAERIHSGCVGVAFPCAVAALAGLALVYARQVVAWMAANPKVYGDVGREWQGYFPHPSRSQFPPGEARREAAALIRSRTITEDDIKRMEQERWESIPRRVITVLVAVPLGVVFLTAVISWATVGELLAGFYLVLEAPGGRGRRTASGTCTSVG